MGRANMIADMLPACGTIAEGFGPSAKTFI